MAVSFPSWFYHQLQTTKTTDNIIYKTKSNLIDCLLTTKNIICSVVFSPFIIVCFFLWIAIFNKVFYPGIYVQWFYSSWLFFPVSVVLYATDGMTINKAWWISHHPCMRVDSSDKALRWRHNGRDSVSNHQPNDCLLKGLFIRRSKKKLKLRVTGLCAGNSLGTGESPTQMASNAENASIWWRHHGMLWLFWNVIFVWPL